MPYKFDYRDGDVLAWELTDDGAAFERTEDYTPTIYVSAETDELLATARRHLRGFPTVERTARERKRVGFRHDPEAVLRVDVAGIDAVRDVAGTVAGWQTPGAYRLYDVDFTREFRFWLEEVEDRTEPDDDVPVPDRALRTVEIDAPIEQIGRGDLRRVTVDGVTVEGPTAVVETVRERVETVDPDVLLLASSRLVPLLYDLAAAAGVDDFDLGRLAGYDKLAGASTYESYGQVGHSPARYNVPGRAIIDRSNTFMWNQTNLEGCLYLIERSGLPLQELAWSSIGRILTAIQIREARRRDVLVPWHSWRHEFFKPMPTLRAADRGGFTFAPDVGLHEDVHELDFSSLYPNIIATRNVSPERICCDCHPDRTKVPGLDYNICPEEGYLPGLLRTLIDDRDDFKERLAAAPDGSREQQELEGKVDAIKWILVSCFGYQGFSNAKFGRIECHEAINAFAREILLDAKEALEAGGWRVLHGIVDSLWVAPIEDVEQTDLRALAAEISEGAGIRLEYESPYDWIAFVPRRNDDAGALTKYFGRWCDGEFKYRGIECRQRSTPPYVETVQRELIAVLDRTRDPERVCDALAGHLAALRRGDVDPADLAATVRVSKVLDDYDRETRTVAALTRADAGNIDRYPGQGVSYVVVDDDAGPMERVRLAHESPDGYDIEYYAEQLRRATESVLSPLGWPEDDIRRYLADRTDASLARFA
jgi:DNA polymerase I